MISEIIGTSDILLFHMSFLSILMVVFLVLKFLVRVMTTFSIYRHKSL